MNQHWLSEDFKHRRRSETHEVSFWMDNTASDEVYATKAVVEVKHEIYTTRMEFDWPKERAKLADLERMFERVFEKGRHDAKREIRKVLGCS